MFTSLFKGFAWQRWGYFGVLMGFALSLGSCTKCDFTAGRYDRGQIPSGGGGDSFVAGAVDTQATPSPSEDTLPSLHVPDLLLLVLRCEPKTPDQKDHEPLVRRLSMGEYRAYLQTQTSDVREAVQTNTGVVLSRTLNVEIKGKIKDVPLSYLLPMRVFSALVPEGDPTPVADLLYQLGIPMPTELLSYYLEQGVVPQFDDPEVYAQTKETLLQYFKFSKELHDHLRSEQQKTAEEMRSVLSTQGLKPADIETVLSYYMSPTTLKTPGRLWAIFVSPENCRLHTPMNLGIPAWGQISERRIVVEPGEIIDQLWAEMKWEWRIGGWGAICPSPTPEAPQTYVGLPGGGFAGGGDDGDDDVVEKDPCDPKKGEGGGE